MKGYLDTQGLHGIGQARVGKALQDVAPEYHVIRQTTAARRANPIPYHAEYFGHKLHIDQNKKLNMFGVTHVAGIDGYSGKIVQLITIPQKNNQLIYNHLYRPIVLNYGLWDQIRVDTEASFF